MKVRVMKKTPNELKLEVEGVGHTICNLLQKRLLDDQDVELAGYNIPHPSASSLTIYVYTKGTNKPEETLRKTVERTRKMNKEFRKEFKRALKKT